MARVGLGQQAPYGKPELRLFLTTPCWKTNDRQQTCLVSVRRFIRTLSPLPREAETPQRSQETQAWLQDTM